MKSILKSSLTILGALALVVGASGAFFSDTERSEGNVFAAGAVDLKVDSEAHYNGMVCTEVDESVFEWMPEDGFSPGPNHYPREGSLCDGTWTETDLGPTHTFFNYGDLKPGDHGENTISLHVLNNDAYACAIIDNMQDDDLGLTEPEEEDGDTTDGPGNGELSEYIRFFAWEDDGNNVWEDGEIILFSNTEGPASDVIDGVTYPLYVPQTEPMIASSTEYIGLFWCFGQIGVNEDANELTCDGGPVDNIPQSDALSADITFYVEQARNNETFECPQMEEPPEECELVQTYADEVVFVDQGLRKNSTAVLPDRSVTSYALGEPQSDGDDYDSPVVPSSFFSLGFPLGGHTAEIVLSFNDNYVVDGPGVDLKLWEVTGGNNYPNEKVDVYIGDTIGDWTQVGFAVTRDAEIDINPSGITQARYVRIVDASNIGDFSDATADGFDLDAVQAINCIVSS